MRTRRLIPALLASLTLGLAACGGDDEEPVTAKKPTTTTTSASPAPERAGGKILVAYAEPQDETEALWKEILSVGGLDGVAENLSTQFKLRHLKHDMVYQK